ncbi:helix-turn-helix transcriptional regulator [Saccharomonospora xinjiangensis]|uniref:Putative transcriptional regulator n=1 Tax=Saccharomonospora xinjiangensis XJ-54 TaxID=882086 RepID=I0V7P0_9PSEU|nr:YafY family protein [Saccharomonospora xinjiangensis]EID56143.1 putative transcriptional regulator [Saccharomonospora xinjiangensis XJ-54]
MGTPGTRLLQLLSLLQNGRSWQAAELAERLRVSPRTLRRDLDQLRELGYPVSSARGPGGHYRLVAGQALPPLLFTDEEAVGTVVGLRLVAPADPTGAAEGALRKLGQVLPSRLRHQVRAVAASIRPGSRRTPAAADLRLLHTLGATAHAHQDVRFRYAAKQGATASRRVEPYRLVHLGRRWYVLGWDRDRGDWRTFRLDRISELTVPGTTFVPRPLPENAVPFPSHTHDPASRERGVVRFSAPLAVVSERLDAEAGYLEAVDDATCRYVTAPDSWEWLAVTLAAVGVPYTIEGPPELADLSRSLAERMAAAADADQSTVASRREGR